MRSTQPRQIRLKASVYALVEPTLGAYLSVRGAEPRLAPLHLATIAPATEECRECLARLASSKLAGIPHELVRVDAA